MTKEEEKCVRENGLKFYNHFDKFVKVVMENTGLSKRDVINSIIKTLKLENETSI